MSETEIIPIDQVLPNKLPIIPLSGRPIFPGIFTPIMIGNTEDVKVIEEAISGDGMVGLVMIKNDFERPKADDLHAVGTAAKIVKKHQPSGRGSEHLHLYPQALQDQEVPLEGDADHRVPSATSTRRATTRTRSRPSPERCSAR